MSFKNVMNGPLPTSVSEKIGATALGIAIISIPTTAISLVCTAVVFPGFKNAGINRRLMCQNISKYKDPAKENARRAKSLADNVNSSLTNAVVAGGLALLLAGKFCSISKISVYNYGELCIRNGLVAVTGGMSIIWGYGTYKSLIMARNYRRRQQAREKNTQVTKNYYDVQTQFIAVLNINVVVITFKFIKFFFIWFIN